MEDNIDNIKLIIEELMLTPKAKRTSNQLQIHIRCRMPDCGDSENPNSAHMYVGINKNDPTKLSYDCKKCGAHGNVSDEFLRMYDIDPSKFLSYFKTSTSGLKKTYDMNRNKKLVIDFPKTYLSADKWKIDYICKRLGRDICDNDISSMKIVINLNKFLEFNKIDKIALDLEHMREGGKNINEVQYIESMTRTLDELSKNFIGFLSANNNRITMRNLGSEVIGEKYFVLTIDPSIQDPFIYYPKMDIDICSREPEIVMAEGVFDILNIREKFYGGTEGLKDVFFVAVGGSGSYRRCLKSIISMTGWVDAHVTIYSDSDIAESQYQKMFREFSEYISFTIVYNTSSKDFGDSTLPCTLRRVKLKWP